MADADLPDLPLIALERDAHRVAVFDPRPDPPALGMRYTHGGWIASWEHDGRELTGRPRPGWDPGEGCGLPDVFERGLGVAAVREGEEFLRIGCGRIPRHGRGWNEYHVNGAAPVAWEIIARGDDHLAMVCEDRVRIGDGDFAYHLRRRVALTDHGPEVASELRLDVPWSEPLVWFAHPFFAHEDATGTRLHLPAGATTGGELPVADGMVVLPAAGGFGAVAGLHGHRGALRCRLDPRRGGGTATIVPDFACDKLVVFASAQAFSVEPYLVRALHAGERLRWNVAYRFGLRG